MPFDRQISEEEKAFVKDFKARIDSAVEKTKDRFKLFESWRIQYEGFASGKERKGEKVRTNLIFSTMQTVLPRIYARNPDISITPGEAVSDDQYGLYKKFGQTCESFLDKIFVRGAKLKRRGKACVRSSMVTSIGWGKLTLQREWGEDPIAKARLNDAQENLKNIDGLAVQIEAATGSDCDRELLRAKVQAEVESLTHAPEVVKRKGLVLDKLHGEDVIILDDSVQDFDSYQESRAMAHQLWVTEDEFTAKFGFTPDEVSTAGYGSPTSYSAPRGVADPLKKQANTNSQPGKQVAAGGGTGEKRWYHIYEIWDHEHNQVHTWGEGMECWLKLSYCPTTGEHWYCFFPLVFNIVDGSFYGLSDVELLIKLQEEYNSTRDDFAKHRKENLPVRVAREGGNLTPDDVNKISNRQSGDIIVIKGGGGQPLSHDLMVMDNPPIDPANYDTLPIRTDVELISGASDAANGAVQKAKTATEASYLQEGLANRTSERQDALEDWVKELGTYALQIGLQVWSLADVQEIAGKDAVWPQMDKAAMFDKINIEVRAGSSGKPNSQDEREHWTNLLPVLKEATQAVAEMRQLGNEDMAQALIEMMKETFRRFDERIDIDAFFPRQQAGDPTQELAQCKQELMQAQQELQALHQELDKVGKGEYSKVAAEQTKIAAEQTKAEAERTKQLDITNRSIMEKQRIESDERIAKHQADLEAQNIRFRVTEEIRGKVEIAKFEAEQKTIAEREAMSSAERQVQHKTEHEAKSRTEVANITAKTKAESDQAVAAEKAKTERDAKPAEIPGLKELVAANKEAASAVDKLIKAMAKDAAADKGNEAPKVKIVELTGPKGMTFKGSIRVGK